MTQTRGMALITVLMFLTVIAALMATYSFITRTEVQSLHASKSYFSGFNAAEAGLNLRAELIKNKFENYNRPSGVSPASADGCAHAETAGSGDFACQNFDFASKHQAVTYVVQNPDNPFPILIQRGEPFANLTASEYRFTVTSEGRSADGRTEANLELMFKTRLIPLFQFLIFFDDDLELISGTGLHASGPIHSNHDIFHAMQAAWWISDPHSYWMGPISAVGKQYRGLKSITTCHAPSGQGDDGYYYDIYVNDLSGYRVLPGCPGGRFHMTDDQLAPYNGNMLQNVPKLTVPDIRTFEAFALPDPDQPNTFTYWQRADLRLVLRLDSANLPITTNAETGIEVVDASGNLMADATAKLNDSVSCPGNKHTGGRPGLSVGAKGDWNSVSQYSADDQLRLFRDFTLFPATNSFETVLDVDLRNFLSCVHKYKEHFLSSGDLDETGDGGLVLFFALDGPHSHDLQNNYAVRINNAAKLQANDPGAPHPKGMTIVTDQKAVLWGDFNSVDADWIPSAVISDSQYVLSNVWTDALSTHRKDGTFCDNPSIDGNRCADWWNRFTNSNDLTINTAILSGVTPACGANGVTCEGYLQASGGGYYGMFRFNETYYDGDNYWSSSYHQPNFNWKGSIVSVHSPKHNQAMMVGPTWYYSEPAFVWAFDTRFNNPASLPPLTPQAVYNRQELFERNYTH